jgi:poly(3-hydroxybutyrate) depolymerase
MRPAIALFLLCAVVRAEPAGSGAVPLLVVLHGDGETAKDRAKPWREAVARRGWKLLALDCPRARGCDDGAWYRWDGDPQWIHDQVRDLASRVPIDVSRVYLAGWSGGATYIGKRLPAWSSMFAAVVIHGGGVPPRSEECPDRAFPAYFLVGDRNPAHDAARRLRDYFVTCKQEVKWDLVPGANHEQEDAALTPRKAAEILRWLASRSRTENLAS